MSFYGNTDFLLEIAKGNIAGHTLLNIASANFDIDANIREDVWIPGGTMIYPIANEAWEIVSDSVDDTDGGIGANEVEVEFLDEDYITQAIETIVLNGTTPVPFVATNCFRSQSVIVTKVGTNGSNVGKIIIRRVSDSEPRDGISPGDNLSGNSHKTIPAGKSGYVVLASAFVGKNKDVIVRQQRTDGANGIFTTIYGIALYQQTIIEPLPLSGGKIIEKSDIKMVCDTENANTAVGVTIQLVLVDD